MIYVADVSKLNVPSFPLSFHYLLCSDNNVKRLISLFHS